MSVRRPAPGALSQTATSTSRRLDEVLRAGVAVVTPVESSRGSPHLGKYEPLEGKELYELWISIVREWSKLVLDPSPPTLLQLQAKDENMKWREAIIIHTMQQSIEAFDFMRRVQREQPDLKTGAEWLIKTIKDHRKLREVALMYRKWVDQRIAPMEAAKEQLAKTILLH